MTISNQEIFAGGTETAPAVIFNGPAAADKVKYGFSFVPAEAAAAKFNLCGFIFKSWGHTNQSGLSAGRECQSKLYSKQLRRGHFRLVGVALCSQCLSLCRTTHLVCPGKLRDRDPPVVGDGG